MKTWDGLSTENGVRVACSDGPLVNVIAIGVHEPWLPEPERSMFTNAGVA